MSEILNQNLYTNQNKKTNNLKTMKESKSSYMTSMAFLFYFLELS